MCAMNMRGLMFVGTNLLGISEYEAIHVIIVGDTSVEMELAYCILQISLPGFLILTVMYRISDY